MDEQENTVDEEDTLRDCWSNAGETLWWPGLGVGSRNDRAVVFNTYARENESSWPSVYVGCGMAFCIHWMATEIDRDDAVDNIEKT